MDQLFTLVWGRGGGGHEVKHVFNGCRAPSGFSLVAQSLFWMEYSILAGKCLSFQGDSLIKNLNNVTNVMLNISALENVSTLLLQHTVKQLLLTM